MPDTGIPARAGIAMPRKQAPTAPPPDDSLPGASPAVDDHITPGQSIAYPIVAVGASAGGLDAFKRFLEALPIDTGMAFVLIQHLDPTHQSLLSSILSRSTAMPVREVEHNMPARPNAVFVIPPTARTWSIARGLLSSRPARSCASQHRPVDHFMRALAAEHGYIGDRRDPLGHRERRHARHPGDQDRGRHHLRARRQRRAAGHAPQRDGLRGGGLRDAARRDRARAGAHRKAPAGRTRCRRAGHAARPPGSGDPAHLRAAARVARRGLHQLQAQHHQPAHHAAHALEPRHHARRIPEDPRVHAGRGRRPLPRHPDQRHELLPQSRGLRGAQDRGLPAHHGAEDAQRHAARLGAGLLDGRGSVFARHGVHRICRGCEGALPYPDLRERRERLGHREGAHRCLSPRHRAGLERRAVEALLRRDRRQLPRDQADPRHVRVRAPERHRGSALLAPRPRGLPQPADLPRAGAAAEADGSAALLAQRERHAVARAVGDHRSAPRPVRGRRHALQVLRAQARGADPPAGDPRRLPAGNRRRGCRHGGPPAARGLGGRQRQGSRSPDPRALRPAGRGRQRPARRGAVPRRQHAVPAALGRARQPEPAEDGARGAAGGRAQRRQPGAARERDGARGGHAHALERGHPRRERHRHAASRRRGPRARAVRERGRDAGRRPGTAREGGARAARERRRPSACAASSPPRASTCNP